MHFRRQHRHFQPRHWLPAQLRLEHPLLLWPHQKRHSHSRQQHRHFQPRHRQTARLPSPLPPPSRALSEAAPPCPPLAARPPGRRTGQRRASPFRRMPNCLEFSAFRPGSSRPFRFPAAVPQSGIRRESPPYHPPPQWPSGTPPRIVSSWFLPARSRLRPIGSLPVSPSWRG